MPRLSAAVGLAVGILVLGPGSARAAVTATTELSSEGIALTVMGDAADDNITISCAGDGATINGHAPAGPAACADITSIAVDGGAGDDLINLAPVTPDRGFTNLCGPCADGGYSIVAECAAGSGNDTIAAAPVGTLIGGCFGQTSMPGNDRVMGGQGDDAIAGGAGKDRLTGNAGDDQVFGGPNADEVVGLAGDDLLVGKQGNDVLVGAGGDDRLAGGPGRDSMSGGEGNDSCIAGPDGGTARRCESIRGVSRAVSLGFAPRLVTD